MKHNLTKSKLYSFTVGLAMLGLLAIPVGGSHLLKGGSGQVASSEDDTDWTLASKNGIPEEETDWTLAKTKAGEDETDWTLASKGGIHEEEVAWALA